MRRVPRALAFARSLLLDLIAPSSCVVCASARQALAPFCASCGQALVRRSERDALDDVPLIAPYWYEPPLSAAIAAFKYAKRTDLAGPLAELLHSPLTEKNAGTLGCDWLIPVPLHRERLLDRGYNQSALLAGRLQNVLHGRVCTRALSRTRSTPQQVGQTREQRLGSVAHAFEVTRPERVRGSRVVLIDDVVTTGATALECIRALTSAGARVCAVVAVARTKGAAQVGCNREFA